MPVLRVVTIHVLMLFGLSSALPLDAGEETPAEEPVASSGIITQFIAKTDKPAMTPDLAIPTEAEAEAGLPDTLDVDQRAEALRLRCEAMLARRILAAFYTRHAAMSYTREGNEQTQKMLDRVMKGWGEKEGGLPKLNCCLWSKDTCDAHRYMTPEEHRDEYRLGLELDLMAMGVWPTPEALHPDDRRTLLDDYRRVMEKKYGVRKRWMMVFLPGHDDDEAMKSASSLRPEKTESARQRAEAAYRRLTEGDSWEVVATEDSDNARINLPPDGALGRGLDLPLIQDAAKLWDTMDPDEVSAPQQGIKRFFLTKWKPLDDDDDKYLLDMAGSAYRQLQQYAWRKAALEAAAEALRSSDE